MVDKFLVGSDIFLELYKQPFAVGIVTVPEEIFQKQKRFHSEMQFDQIVVDNFQKFFRSSRVDFLTDQWIFRSIEWYLHFEQISPSQILLSFEFQHLFQKQFWFLLKLALFSRISIWFLAQVLNDECVHVFIWFYIWKGVDWWFHWEFGEK